MRDRQIFKHQPGFSGSARLGALIEQARNRRGLSRADLAREVDVSISMIGKIERGNRPITSIETATNFAEALGISVDSIYAAQGIMPPDVLELLQKCASFHIKRARWALQKIADGEMFDEEVKRAAAVAGELPGNVLITRERTVREERAWSAIQEARRLAESVTEP